MQLTEFKRNPDTNSFHIKFDDSFEADISAETIRKNCPCAECKGEEVLLHKYVPRDQKPLTVESFTLEKVQMVGNYAIQFFWKDGHNTGLFNWEYLKEISKKS
jgi:DUF971 family protein